MPAAHATDGGTPHTLSGPDLFHLLIDRVMRVRGCAGDVSRMVFDLEPGVDADTLKDRFAANALFRWVRALHWRTAWPGLPRWEFAWDVDTTVPIHQAPDMDAWTRHQLAVPLMPADGAVRVDIARAPDGRVRLMIALHHVAFDHAGMLRFLHGLNDGLPEEDRFAPNDVPRPQGEWRDVLAMGATAFRSAGPRMGSLLRGRKGEAGDPDFHIVRFTPEETARIDAQARASGATIGRTTFDLAAIALAMNGVLQTRGRRPPYLWFSTPIDQRPRKGPVHLIGNATSFVFFKLHSAELTDMSTAVKALSGQLITQVRGGFPTRYRALLRAFRRVPFAAYRIMFNMPSVGRWASFAFSDLGDLDRLPTHFFGARITHVEHYPPVPSPPGLSVVMGREKGGLVLVIGHRAPALTPEEADGLVSRLRGLLLPPV
ncbi:MAG: hypothetical protein H6595_13500 [Flavobacteriales bacterium]|nr:hypothetical protein [Flavobacteriales bacterium]MCB9168482.1 hypothetical protein [Flavobacteriales bacterium]MCB9182265.1 hypothetical protein [Flavobacteriales bacterium]